MIKIPSNVQVLIEKIEDYGGEAFVVGGCVRDSMLGRVPRDWDITTSLLPEETKECLKGYNIVETGIQHGTVTAIIDHEPFEITTYRVDGEYTDGRHPDSVSFSKSLAEDLARRDFTVNAMAYNDSVGLVDLYGGRRDLENRIIRCVGDPRKRFSEDALRIMRAIRFAAVLGFRIEKETEAAIREFVSSVRPISVERIQVEFTKLLMGAFSEQVLIEYQDVMEDVLGIRNDLSLATGDSGMGILVSENEHRINPRSIGRLSMNLPERAVWLMGEAAPKVVINLRYDKNTIRLTRRIVEVVKNIVSVKFWENDGSRELNITETQILVALCNYGETVVRAAFEIADVYMQVLAESEEMLFRGELVEMPLTKKLEEVLQRGSCYNLRMLAITGSDLVKAGFEPGQRLGEVLKLLLKMVMSGDLKNSRDCLIEAAKKL